MFPRTKLNIIGFVGAFFMLLLSACISATEEEPVYATPVESDVVLDDRYPQRLTSFPGGVTGLPDVIYSVLPGFRPLSLDLYLPSGAAKEKYAYPLLVYVHGGGWDSGHTRHAGAFANWPGTLASIAAHGYVVASVEYRLIGEAPSDSGPVPPAVANYLGCTAQSCDVESVVAASPISHIDSKDPPFLLVHGSDDSVVPVAQSQQMNAKLANAGVATGLITIPNVNHSFIGESPAATDAASQLAFTATMAFVEKTVGNRVE